MAKVLSFFKGINLVKIFNILCDIYLLSIVMSGLYLITQATSKFAVGKYSVAIVMALLIAFIIDRLRK
jgi:hypothetical protein